MRITERKKVHVPWLELARNQTEYLDGDTIPNGFEVLDPSKLTVAMIDRLWNHWSLRAAAKQPILIFKNARSQDTAAGVRRQQFAQSMKNFRVASDDQVGDSGHAGNSHSGKRKGEANKGQEMSQSAVTPLPSKRPRLFRGPVVPEEQSPGANNGDKQKFLVSLSSDTSYKVLLDAVLALPAFVSYFFIGLNLPNITLLRKTSAQSSSLDPESNLTLPIWASWDWGQKYLPRDIHTKPEEFQVALGLLRNYQFADHNKGTPVVLGFGLLLRECWRAIEVEDDDEDSPKFLQESLLGEKRVKRVIMAIKEVIGALPLVDANKERPKEKELEASTEGQKGRAGKDNHATRMCPTHAPSTAPSTSKPSGTRKRGGDSPVKNTRSQRQRKPSKKLRGED